MKRTFLFSFILALALPVGLWAQKVNLTKAETATAEGITAAQLKNYLYFVSSDAMGGRDTPSQGLDVTAEFIKMNLEKWGFKPAGDNGTFFQKIALHKEALDPSKTSLKVGDTAFTFGEDFFPVGGKGSGSGKVVFAGDGWLVRSKGIDAYSSLDPAGKVVVIAPTGFSPRSLAPRPAGVTDDDLKGTKGVDWANPLDYAKARGAVAVIVIAPPQLQTMWPQLRNFLGRGSTYPEKLRETDASENAIPVVLASKKVGDAILAGESIEGQKAKDLSKTAAVTSEPKVETLWTQNVVAIWEGSDPVLKNEMVAIGAHYDHVGTNPNAPGDDKIWNGADDDGSGTVAVLSIAEALSHAKERPKRSILFVWHCGEEKGLWGSEYFNKFPTVDIKKVIAQLNIDMIGRSLDPNNVIKCDAPGKRCNEELSKADEIYVIGKDMMSSTLGSIVDQTNNSYLKLKYNTRYDDPNDKNRFFFRSDHFNYAQNGIPIAFWFDGVHEDYHQASDTADKIDYHKMEQVARTIFLTMWELTDLKERPKIDKELPPELKQQR